MALLCISEHNVVIVQETSIILSLLPQPGLNVNRESVLLFHLTGLVLGAGKGTVAGIWEG